MGKFKTKNIPKKNGKIRTITMYNMQNYYGRDMRREEYKLKNELDTKGFGNKFFLNSFAYKKGCRKELAIVPHLENDMFMTFDIKSFFDRIPLEELKYVIKRQYNTGKKEKRLAERLCKILDGYETNGVGVKQGSILSPYFSEMYMNSFDEVMTNVCDKNGFKYSRYADDILFSYSNETTKQERINVINAAFDKIKALGLQFDKDKYKEGSWVEFLGLVVSNEYCDFPRDYVIMANETNNIHIKNYIISTRKYFARVKDMKCIKRDVNIKEIGELSFSEWYFKGDE